MVNRESTEVLPFQQPHGALTSTFAAHLAHFLDAPYLLHSGRTAHYFMC
jgi:hypothetical protein